LATQLAERLGIECEPWMVVFVKEQIQDAYNHLELDVRLSGGANKAPGGASH